ncbi:PREDICTED: methionine--tRNA ligase, mitochondrial [Nanorana parkeri]|uniref:methionine--tRNA ligase, mitochondrial n=1 Tax=Nanorana parkeri TaxID=125878 RepID=UPI000854DA42|nr:PREDICTED: methionine--tRNA ligase, mitochondrial [Nanorana parkeri]
MRWLYGRRVGRWCSLCFSRKISYGGPAQGRPQLFTTPIFYVNAAPHLGHVYSAVLADTLHRYTALRGGESRLNTGTDEHGIKVQQAAAALGSTPTELCSRVSQQFRTMFDAMGISYTDFVRTTEPRHSRAVCHFWKRLEEQGYIYKGTYQGWYCTSDEAFLSEEQTTESKDPDGNKIRVSVESGHQVHWMSEENYMFRLSSLRPELLKWLQTDPIHPAPFLRIVRKWLEEELPDLSVSRHSSRVSWGIPVPSDPTHTIYVWLDALINYLTVANYPDPAGSPWGPSTHLLGKDILRFHAVYWPAFLLAAGLPPPAKLFVHSHWTCQGVKMSKSLLNVIDPAECIKLYGRDGFRYFLLRNGSPERDCDFNHDAVRMLLKSDLADALGGLLNRSTALNINPEQCWPCFRTTNVPLTSRGQLEDLLGALQGLPQQVDQYMDTFQVHKALEAIDGGVRSSNTFLQRQAPWKLSKGSEEDKAWGQCVLYLTLEALRLYGTLLQPAVPGLAQTILSRLGVGNDDRTLKGNRFFAATRGEECRFRGQKLGLDCGLLYHRLRGQEDPELKKDITQHESGSTFN